ncbi:MAG: hypothetical protein AAGH42_05840, partial [Pseudomonadota bacterium]
MGPQTEKRLRRSLTIYAGIFCAALVTALFVPHPNAVNLSMGLLVPGGAFLMATPHLPFAALAIIMFGAGIIAWFGTGNSLGAPAVWVISAFAVLFLPTQEVNKISTVMVFCVFGGAAGGLALGFWRLTKTKANSPYPLPVYLDRPKNQPTPYARDAQDAQRQELSLSDLKAMRLLLDRALQPIPDFAGFEWRDQFQTGAIRYQLNFLSYALAFAQSVYAPAARAPFATAQKNLLRKQGDPRVWRYWLYERAWGHLSFDADPINRDNIMYSGFGLAQMLYTQHADYTGLFLDNQQALQCYSQRGQSTKPAYDYS